MSDSVSVAMQPTRRDLHFNLQKEKIATWNKGDPHLSHFMNTLSIFFPVGERFFIESVRHYRDQITDPELQKAVTAFIGQEAMHGREHEEYNQALFDRVPFSQDVESFVSRLLGRAQKRLPKSWQLSTTIALEHFTAILADALLSDPRILEGSDERFVALWNWHALEETEHKAVAYDVWRSVMGRTPYAYGVRTITLLVATLIFWSITLPAYAGILRREGILTQASGWRHLFRYTFGEVGVIRKISLPWAEYFKPGFHPWDHDNRHFLDRLEALEAKLINAA